MKRLPWTIAIALVSALCISPAVASAEDAAHGYIGPKKCGMCHKKDEDGAQLSKWQEGPHAGAYAALASDEAKKYAAERGLGDPQQEDACLKCHVTGHGMSAEILGTKWNKEDGVTCEGCHGFGADYKSKKVMQDREQAIANGLVIPTAERQSGCWGWGGPSP